MHDGEDTSLLRHLKPASVLMLLHQGIEATSFSEGGASVAGTALTDSPGSLGTALTAAAVDMGAMKQYANSSSISAGGVRRALQVRVDGGAWEGALLNPCLARLQPGSHGTRCRCHCARHGCAAYAATPLFVVHAGHAASPQDAHRTGRTHPHFANPWAVPSGVQGEGQAPLKHGRCVAASVCAYSPGGYREGA